MIETSNTTEAEKTLQSELDASTKTYSQLLDRVQREYFRDLAILHEEYAREQSQAVERYHKAARAQLSDIIDGLDVALKVADQAEPIAVLDSAGSMSTHIPDGLKHWTGESVFPAPEQSGFFADDPIVCDPALLDEVDRSWNPFRRRQSRHGA